MGEGGMEGSSEALSQPPGASASAGFRTLFLSYASPDAAVANQVCEFLESRGVPCWMAPRDVKPGAAYADAIVRAINEASALVLVLSGAAMASEHVSREVERAGSKHKPIVAFRFDAAVLSAELEYFLSRSQWIDVPALGMAAALVKLVEAVGQGSAAAHASPGFGGVGAGRASVQQPVGSASVAKRAFVAAGVVVALGLGGVLAIRFWQSKHGESRASVPATATISDKSIAVLPFADMSEKKDQEYFADGIAEEVLDRLTQVPGLKVVGRASSFQFRSRNSNPAGIGTELGVAYLLEGSVRREGGRVRVTAQLVETRSGAQRWSDRFDSDLVGMLQVQDTIAVEIARALQIAVEVDTAPRSSIKSPESLDAYLRGLQSVDRQSRESSEAAVASFQQALALDPTFAPAAIGLAKAYTFIGNEGWLSTKVAFERARKAALLAKQLDPQSPSPHVRLAEIYVTYDWDWAGADRELNQALALGPRNSDWARIASERAAAIGQWDDARQLGIAAVALDPLNPAVHMILGWSIYLHTGDFAEAEQAFRRGLQIAPQWGSGRYFLGEALMLQGHHELALAEFRRESPDDGQLEGSAMVHFAAGRKSESDAALAEAIRHNGTSWPSEIARVYAFRGEKDRAFEWLERAFDLRDEDLYVIKGDPLLKNIEGDPRYVAFLKKMNLPE
jgi:TolB-like protein/tetratricopeptide (TPR) repeat protein